MFFLVKPTEGDTMAHHVPSRNLHQVVQALTKTDSANKNMVYHSGTYRAHESTCGSVDSIIYIRYMDNIKDLHVYVFIACI